MITAEPTKAVTFPPKFTYPIFGDSEQIFGYKDLRIDLAFDCESLKPLLTYKYSSKLSEDIKSIEEIMGKFLPAKDYILKSESLWMDSIEEEKFQLPKESIVYNYERRGNKFDIYKFKLDNESIIGKKLLLRMQILTLLFIEAGSYIDLNDPMWELYTIYEKNEIEGKSIFVGFCTCYKHWKFNSSEEHDKSDINNLKYRGKLSQIIILPKFQGNGHGKEIYEFICNEWIKDDKCVEITIEDPNEEFDQLRDKCDLQRIINSGILKDIREIPIKYNDCNELQKRLKLTKRQFDRLIEMSMYWLNKNKDGEWIKGLNEKNIRLLIKKRIYLNNKEGLEALNDDSLVKSKLQEVYSNIIENEYNNLVADVIRPLKRK